MNKDIANMGLSETSHAHLKEMADLDMFNDLKMDIAWPSQLQ